MPAPKAVLRDLADQGLDPTQAHHRITSTGRLAGPVTALPLVLKSALVSVAAPPPAVEEKPSPKVEAKAEKKVEPVKVEQPKVEEKVIEPAKVETKAKVEKKEAPKTTEVVPEAPKAADDAKKA